MTMDQAREALLPVFGDDTEEYIQAFITGMVLQSGSIDAFLKERLGLDEETKAQLQDMYLE